MENLSAPEPLLAHPAGAELRRHPYGLTQLGPWEHRHAALLDAGQVGREGAGEAGPCIFQQGWVVRGVHPCAGGREVVESRHDDAKPSSDDVRVSHSPSPTRRVQAFFSSST